MIDRDQIKAVFLRNGFSVKVGQTDLKPYVYAAAEELLRLAAQQRAAVDERLGADARRFRLFAETVVAECQGKSMTPAQQGLFRSMNTLTSVSNVGELVAMFDAAMAEKEPSA